jgi:hypothetical protein
MPGDQAAALSLQRTLFGIYHLRLTHSSCVMLQITEQSLRGVPLPLPTGGCFQRQCLLWHVNKLL